MGTEGEIATNTDPAGLWSLVVPLKPLARAKSRLGRAAGELARPRLALAFAQDTVVAALSCAVPVAALNADLPALRAGELARVLDFASAFPRAFLRDAAGIGTTFLSC